MVLTWFSDVRWYWALGLAILSGIAILVGGLVLVDLLDTRIFEPAIARKALAQFEEKFPRDSPYRQSAIHTIAEIDHGPSAKYWQPLWDGLNSRGLISADLVERGRLVRTRERENTRRYYQFVQQVQKAASERRSGKRPLVLKCSGCETVYTVGVDAIITSWQEVVEQARAAGQVMGGSPDTPSPDLVARMNRDSVRKSVLDEIHAVNCKNLSQVAKDPYHTWQCGQCGHKQQYFVDLPPV